MATRQKSGTKGSSTKKKSTAAKGTTKKSTAANRRTKESSAAKKRTDTTSVHNRERLEDYRDYQVSYMVCVLLLVFCLSVILYMTYFGFGKTFGIFTAGIAFGIFGWFAWLLPIYLFMSAAFYFANYGSNRVICKIIYTALFFCFIQAFLQLFLHSKVIPDYYIEGKNLVLHASRSASNPVIEMFRLIRTEGKGGCGIIAYAISHGLTRCFGSFITGMILLAATLLAFWGLFGKMILENLRKRNAYYDEMEHIYQEEREKEDYIEPSYRLRKNVPAPISDEERKAKVTTFNLKKMEDVEEIPPETKKSRRGKARKKRMNIDMEEIVPVSASEEKVLPFTQDKPSVSEEEIYKKFGEAESSIESANEAKIEEDEFSIHFPMEQEKVPEESTAHEEEKIEAGKTEAGETDGTKEAKKTDDAPAYKDKEGNGAKSFSSAESVNAALAQAQSDRKAREEDRALQYRYPPIDLLKKSLQGGKGNSKNELAVTASKLQATLQSFGVNVKMGDVTCGPTVTRFELLPEQGVKVSKITNLADDIKLSLAASSIRIEAPIPGKSAVGIEVPNTKKSPVGFRDLIDDPAFAKFPSNLAFAVGKDIAGKNVITDIAKMPHLLIAGATGSGKSVCINTLIMSILYKAHPKDVKLIMIDPKVVELSVYNGIPHLYIPVVTDPKKASAALNWAVMEMMERYAKFADLGVRNISGYNDKVHMMPTEEGYETMPQIVIIVDELADLMMVASKEVEDAICRLAQLARAAGIHLIIATQRPSVNVITGTIKANIPSRVAFSVSSVVDSRTILDSGGAEKLLGQGDMLFFPSGYSEPVRLQGAFVSDEEVNKVVDFLKQENETSTYNEAITDHIANNADTVEKAEEAEKEAAANACDEYFSEAGRFIITSDKASVGMLQRKFSIGFNRAARIMDQLEEAGVVGPAVGTKPRNILMTIEEFEQMDAQ